MLESYITPIILSYVDKYIKNLKPEDLQLSFWGGDVVLQKLDLRLDVLEKELHLPLSFSNGHIHELRIHVPWTKLGSEPVVITINTIECVLNLGRSTGTKKQPETESDLRASPTSVAKREKYVNDPDLPAGYVQSVINRISYNIKFVVNNLILKYVEEDIVLSVNVKSAECFSVDSSWQNSFVDLSPTELSLRRICTFSDLTVCLDKRGASGKIDSYQEPMIYRCSLVSRMLFEYDSINAKHACCLKFSTYCESLNISISDQQLPMYIRLCQLCIALYYGTIDDVSSQDGTKNSEPKYEEKDISKVQSKPSTSDPVDPATQENQILEEAENPGWVSWAWSFVPEIVSVEELEGTDLPPIRKKYSDPVLSVGFYCGKSRITFKISDDMEEEAFFSTHKAAIRPLLCLEIDGSCCEILMKGIQFFNAQIGFSAVRLLGLENCVCAVPDSKNTPKTGGQEEVEYYLVSGDTKFEDKEINFLYLSLFNPNSPESKGERAEFFLSVEEHNAIYTETWVIQRFGAFWLDYLYTMEYLYSSEPGSSSSQANSGHHEMKEMSSKHFLFAPAKLRVDSNAVHRLKKFIDCANDHEYESYYKEKPEIVDPERPIPTQEEIASMEEFIPSRLTHYTFLDLVVIVCLADHPSYSRERTAAIAENEKTKKNNELLTLPAIWLHGGRIDIQYSTPMYARRLVRAVSRMNSPSSNLLHHCCSHTSLKLFTFQVGICEVNSDGMVSPKLNILPPCSAAIYKKNLLLSKYWENPQLVQSEVIIEVPSISLALSKAQLILLCNIYMSWHANEPDLTILSETTLLKDVFKPAVNYPDGQPILECTIFNFELKYNENKLVTAASGTVGNLGLNILSSEKSLEMMTPIFSGPVNSANLHSTRFYKQKFDKMEKPEATNDLITFSIQLPKRLLENINGVALLDIQGSVLFIDPMLYSWVQYQPQALKNQGPSFDTSHSPAKKISKGSDIIQQSVKTEEAKETKTAISGLGEDEAELSNKMLYWATLLQNFIFQVNVQCCGVFLLHDHIEFDTRSELGLIQQFREKQLNENPPSALVVCLPKIQVHTPGQTTFSMFQEIPFETSTTQTDLGDRQPWSLSCSDLSVYTLLGPGRVYYLMQPMSLTSTLALNLGKQPAVGTSLGFFIHADLKGAHFKLSKEQVSLIHVLAMTNLRLLNKLKGLKDLTKSHSGSQKVPKRESGAPTSARSLSRMDEHKDNVDELNSTVNESVGDQTASLVESAVKTPAKAVTISWWMQLTLPKLGIDLYTLPPNMKTGAEQTLVKTEIEDLSSSVDIQEDFKKLSCKIRTMNVNNFVRSTGQSWKKGAFDGIILSCSEKITGFSRLSSSKTKDSINFMSLTLTSALANSVKHKLTGGREGNAEELSQQLKHSVGEVCLSIQPCDLVVWCPVIAKLLDLFKMAPARVPKSMKPGEPSYSTADVDKPHGATSSFSAHSERSKSKRSYRSRNNQSLSSQTLPLLYLDLKHVRVFVPTANTQKDSRPSHSPGDTFVLHINSVSVKPYAENPLSRVVLRKDIYSRAVQAGMTLVPGSEVEDRQYQMDVCLMSVCVGCWHRMRAPAPDDLAATTGAQQLVTGQNPALEWNYAKTREKESAYRLDSIVTGFDLQVVAAPAILLGRQTTMEMPEATVVCGHSVEVNMTSDMEIFLNPFHISLAERSFATNLALISGQVDQSEMGGPSHSIGKHRSSAGRASLVDSGVESDVSMAEHSSSAIRERYRVTPEMNLPGKAAKHHRHRLKAKKSLLVPYNILLTAGKVSVLLYSESTAASSAAVNKPSQEEEEGNEKQSSLLSQSSTATERELYRHPFLYVIFSQPHTIVSIEQESQKVELSCYDFNISSCPSDYCLSESEELPSSAEFTIPFIETSPGDPDPKSGILPSLFTLRIVDFLLDKSTNIDLFIGRPVKLNMGLDRVESMQDFVNKIIAMRPETTKQFFSTPETRILSFPEEEDPHTHSSSSKKFISVIAKLRQATFKTCQIVVVLATRLTDTNPSIIISVSKVDGYLNVKCNSKDNVEMVHSSLSMKDLMLKMSYCKRTRPLLFPVSVKVDLNFDCFWQNYSYDQFPRIKVNVKSGLVLISIGQEHFLCATEILHHLQEFLKLKSAETKPIIKHDSSNVNVPKTRSEERLKDIFVVDSSKDDLRIGNFLYTTCKDGPESHHPLPGEIVFCSSDHRNSGTMSWSYTEPRVLTKVLVTPVPFDTSKSHRGYTEQVPCTLEFWDDVRDCFTMYKNFYLSESQSCNMELPAIPADQSIEKGEELIVAQCWRIVLNSNEREPSQSPNFDDDNSSEDLEPLVSPMMLAACMRVDSCFIPSLVPSISVGVLLPVFELRMSNHTQSLGKVNPTNLCPFEFDGLTAADQEFMVLTAESSAICTNHWLGKDRRSITEFSSKIQGQILEYRNLTLQTLVEQFELEGSLRQEGSSLATVDVETDAVFVRIGQSAAHTLGMANQAWQQLDKKDSEKLLFNYYVICNNTQDTLRFGQVDTDETISLHSRKMHAYSWRTHKSLQEIHVCIEGWSNWKWSDSFSIDGLGSFVRHLSHQGRKATLFITVKQLTSLQKQVTISGMYVFVNCLTSDLEIELNKVAYVGSSTMQSKQMLTMAGKSTLPSCLLAEDDITGVRVKFKQGNSSLSEQFAISGEMSNINTLIKIPNNEQNYYMWCRIYSQNFSGAIKYSIIFSPLFVFQNHFPFNVQMHIDTVKANKQQQQQFVIKGKGEQIPLLTIEPSVLHYLTFKKSINDAEISSPRVELSTELLSRLEDNGKESDIDIEHINSNWEDSLDTVWPYNYPEYSSVNEEVCHPTYRPQNQNSKAAAATTTGTVDAEVMVARSSSQLNTLLINISPKCLAINDSNLSLDLLLLEEQLTLSMPSGAVLTPSSYEKPFQISLINGVNDTSKTMPVQLYKQTSSESKRLPSSSDWLCLLQDSHVHDTIVLEQDNTRLQACPLVIRSQMQHQIQVITVQERYIVDNESKNNLSVCPLLINAKVKGKIAAELDDNLLSSSIVTGTSQPLTRWTLGNSSASPPALPCPAADLSYFLMLSLSDQPPPLPGGKWSRPVEVTLARPRQTICLPVSSAPESSLGNMSYCTAAYCIAVMEHSGITYIVIDKEDFPKTTIHNNCAFPLNFGHSLAKKSNIIEEQDFLCGVPCVPPMSSMHYELSSQPDSFPEIKNREVATRFHVSKGPSEEGAFLWSDGLNISTGSELKSEIVGVPNLGYLLVSSQAIGVCVHIVIELLSMLPSSKDGGETAHASSMPLPLAEKSAEVSLYSSQVGLIVVDELSNAQAYREVARATFDGVLFSLYPLKSFGQMVRETCVQLAVNDIQVDNQLYISGAFDFVVLFMKQGGKSFSGASAAGLDTTTVSGIAKAATDHSLLSVKAVVSSHRFSPAYHIQSVNMCLKPVSIYIEDTYVYEIMKLLGSFAPPMPPRLLADSGASSPYSLPGGLKALSAAFLHPLCMQELTIEQLSLSASVHASLKMFLASDHTPLSFGKFERRHVKTTPRQLVQAITMHYASGALFKAGWVIGSLEILGSPGGFVRSLGNGVADFFSLPYEGIIRGPSAFITGVTGGTSSLVRHVSTGTLTSITNFATSVARNLDRLSLDSDHLTRQEEQRRQVPQRLSEGFKSGLSGLGISLLGAVAGIVDQPIQSIQRVSDTPTSPTQKATGVVSGVGKGLVGVVIKPLGGAAELVSRTGQGILHGTGLTQIPKPRFAPFSEQTAIAKNGNLKYTWKMLQSLPNSELLACLDATIITQQGLHHDGCLLLTPEILFMVSISEDMQQQAFSVSEIDCTPASLDSGVLSIKVKQSLTPSTIERDRQSERVADFVDAISPFSDEQHTGTTETSSSDHLLPSTTPVYGPTYHYQVPPHQRDSFIALFSLAQDKLSGKGFCYHESENVAFGRFKAWHLQTKQKLDQSHYYM